MAKVSTGVQLGRRRQITLGFSTVKGRNRSWKESARTWRRTVSLVDDATTTMARHATYHGLEDILAFALPARLGLLSFARDGTVLPLVRHDA